MKPRNAIGAGCFALVWLHGNPCGTVSPTPKAVVRYRLTRETGRFPQKRMVAGSLILEVVDHELRAYSRRRPHRPLWHISGVFMSLPVVTNGGRYILAYRVADREQGGLACLAASGSRRWAVAESALFRVVGSARYAVYSSHSGTYKTGDPEAEEGKRHNWKLLARNITDGRLLWSLPVPLAGDPCAITRRSELWTIRQNNGTHPGRTAAAPSYTLELREVATGVLHRAWHLPSARSRYGDWPFLVVARATERGSTVELSLDEGDYGSIWQEGIRCKVIYNRRTGSLRGRVNGRNVQFAIASLNAKADAR